MVLPIGTVEVAADVPQHTDEGDGGDDGREDAQHDVDWSVDAQAQILGHRGTPACCGRRAAGSADSSGRWRASDRARAR